MSKTVDGTLKTPDGRTRSYHLYVASTVPTGTAVPGRMLVLALHGGGGSGTQFESDSRLDGLAEANDAIVVYPDGVGSGADGATNRTWNSGNCCGVAQRDIIDDVTFMRLLIDDLSSRYPVDPTKVVVVGHSNGGMLAYRLACQLSDRVAAVGVQSGALELDSCAPSEPVSVMHIHGTADENVPIDGGKGSGFTANISFASPRASIRTLAAADHCPTDPADTTDPANPDLLHRVWTPCADGTEVEMTEVTGASHTWMGRTATGPRPGGQPYMGIDSSAALWAFVTAHTR